VSFSRPRTAEDRWWKKRYAGAQSRQFRPFVRLRESRSRIVDRHERAELARDAQRSCPEERLGRLIPHRRSSDGGSLWLLTAGVPSCVQKSCACPAFRLSA